MMVAPKTDHASCQTADMLDCTKSLLRPHHRVASTSSLDCTKSLLRTMTQSRREAAQFPAQTPGATC